MMRRNYKKNSHLTSQYCSYVTPASKWSWVKAISYVIVIRFHNQQYTHPSQCIKASSSFKGLLKLVRL
ncbi:hypothetical protein TorRG33x02_151990 [Trema orientale]|uniref:Uncharacterized protein n=1 Tax=Trema orientale TaxID=63057 RepID=A0A2P5ETU6_TREOI|nr:hypothetical protein TorRG33x02_151990 [Trema orientale]